MVFQEDWTAKWGDNRWAGGRVFWVVGREISTGYSIYSLQSLADTAGYWLVLSFYRTENRQSTWHGSPGQEAFRHHKASSIFLCASRTWGKSVFTSLASGTYLTWAAFSRLCAQLSDSASWQARPKGTWRRLCYSWLEETRQFIFG